LVALVFPMQAWAHATLEKASPGFQQRVSSSPRTVTLLYDQYVKARPGLRSRVLVVRKRPSRERA